ncbi:hypothetical protein GCM10009430_05750 [Aquimarina litoralis]|uniref:HTH araC/xylS-type domain-containing protein n=2 Tax=Aquimarina litoralis TaxID=584605 RepID=A0ABP3TRY2_9FLAO
MGQSVDSLVVSDIDSLVQLDSSIIYEGYERNLDIDTVSSKIFARAYLKKAKIDDIDYKLAYGYCAMASFDSNSFEHKIQYLDSAINITQSTENKYFPTLAYIIKGVAYEGKGKFNIALDNYIRALNWSKKKEDIHYEWIAKHNIGLLKIKIGNYDEAKSIFKEYLKFEESNNIRFWNDSLRYLNTLSTLVSIYRKNEEIDSAISLNRKGMELAIGFPNRFMFFFNKGVNEFYKENFKESIYNLNQSLPEFKKPENIYHYDTSDIIEIYFYLGKSHLGLFEKEKAITYFKKVDSVVQNTGYLTAEIRPAYQHIIKYYKSKKDKNNQLFYINRLLYSDSILSTNFRNLNTKISKEFDTPILLAEKEKLIASLAKENTRISTKNIIISGLLLLALGVAGFYFYRQRLYKKRFLKLVADQSSNTNEKANTKDATAAISKEIIAHLLECLQQFEDKQEYLDPDINMVNLAKRFDSNSNYLSKVINKYKGKNFAQYINDLRVAYVIDKLKNDPIFRKYTVVALAQEIGFNNPESFSKAFYKNTGIYPSYFIKELLKQ